MFRSVSRATFVVVCEATYNVLGRNVGVCLLTISLGLGLVLPVG